MDREYPFIPTDDSTFNVRVAPDYFSATLYMPWGTGRDDAKLLAAEFPKAHRVKASTLSASRAVCGTVGIEVDLRPSKGKGSRNETGEARIRNFVKKARALGYRFELQVMGGTRWINGTPVANTEERQIELAEKWLGTHATGGGFIAYNSERERAAA
jgi:hypothetical protein